MVKTVWEDAYRKTIAGGRERLDPPTPEQMDAYASGRLSPQEADRVREALACYPDLASALVEDPRGWDPVDGTMGRDDVAASWKELQRRMQPVRIPATVAPRIWFWSIAASLLLFVTFASLYVRSTFTIAALRRDLARPTANVERLVLFEDASRGGESSAPRLRLDSAADSVVITLTLVDTEPRGSFRVELVAVDQSPPRTVWGSAIARDADGTFSIAVPRAFFQSRTYRLNLYADAETQPLGSYTFVRLEEP